MTVATLCSFCGSIDPSIHTTPELFERVICPYNAKAFETLLAKHNLTRHYPNLVHNLRHGFPLGLMPNLESTNILPNHPSVLEHPVAVDEYLETEVAAGRMTGPLDRAIVKKILRGPFQSSPLIVAVHRKPQATPTRFESAATSLSRQNRSLPSTPSSQRPTSLRVSTLHRLSPTWSLARRCTQACTLDIAKIHRTCPVLPDHKP
jgi:hypothetical protein